MSLQSKKISKSSTVSYIVFTFAYYPILWMFCNAVQYKAIVSTQKSALKTVSHFYSGYKGLLENVVAYKLMNSIFVAYIARYTKHSLGLILFLCVLSFLANQFYNLRKKDLQTLPQMNTIR